MNLVPTENDQALGPAMRALNPRQRAFVFALFEENPGHGALANAARRAGYGNPDGSSTARTMATIASRLADDERVQAAIQEITKKRIRREGPAAIAAINEIVSNPGHKDKLKAANDILARIDPAESKLNITVEHKFDPVKTTLEFLASLKAKGWTREQLLAEFSPFELDHFEKLLADGGKIVDVEYAEVPAADLDDTIKAEMDTL